MTGANLKKIEGCPYYLTCNQNLCPLDDDINLRVGDALDVCKHANKMREMVKNAKKDPDYNK